MSFGAAVLLTMGNLDSYDCQFLMAGNEFYTKGDGGFINYATYNDGSCTYDSKSRDLWC